MGRRDRERIAKIEAGEETSIAAAKQHLANGNVRSAVTKTVGQVAVKEMSKGSTADQIDRLDRMTGTGELPGGKLRDAIKSKAPSEMDKGIRKLQKQHKEVTVEALTAEAKSTPGFLTMCAKVGIPLSWFEDLARERMIKAGL